MSKYRIILEEIQNVQEVLSPPTLYQRLLL